MASDNARLGPTGPAPHVAEGQTRVRLAGRFGVPQVKQAPSGSAPKRVDHRVKEYRG